MIRYTMWNASMSTYHLTSSINNERYGVQLGKPLTATHTAWAPTPISQSIVPYGPPGQCCNTSFLETIFLPPGWEKALRSAGQSMIFSMCLFVVSVSFPLSLTWRMMQHIIKGMKCLRCTLSQCCPLLVCLGEVLTMSWRPPSRCRTS